MGETFFCICGLEEESETAKALVFAKEKELALALMKVAELTSQLDQLRASTAAAGAVSSPSSERTPLAGRASLSLIHI